MSAPRKASSRPSKREVVVVTLDSDGEQEVEKRPKIEDDDSAPDVVFCNAVTKMRSRMQRGEPAVVAEPAVDNKAGVKEEPADVPDQEGEPTESESSAAGLPDMAGGAVAGPGQAQNEDPLRAKSDEVDALKAELAKKQSILQNAILRLRDERIRADAAESRIDSKLGIIESAQLGESRMCSDLRRQAADAIQKLVEANLEKDALDKQIKRLTTDGLLARNKIDSLLNVNAAITAQYREQAKAIRLQSGPLVATESSSEELEALKLENEQLRAREETVNAVKNEMAQEISTMKEELEASRKKEEEGANREEGLALQINALKVVSGTMDGEISRLREELRAAKSEHARQMDEFMTAPDVASGKMVRKYSSLIEELQVAKNNEEAAKARELEATRQMDALTAEMAELRTANNVANGMVEVLTQSNVQLKNRLNEFTMKREFMMAGMAQLISQCEGGLPQQDQQQLLLLQPKQESHLQPKQESQLQVNEEAQLHPKQESQIQPKQKSELQPKQESQLHTKQESQLQPKQESQLQPKQESESDIQPKQKSQLQPKQESQLPANEEAQLQTKQNSLLQPKQESESDVQPKQESHLQPKQESELDIQVKQLKIPKAESESHVKPKRKSKRRAKKESQLTKKEWKPLLDHSYGNFDTSVNSPRSSSQDVEAGCRFCNGGCIYCDFAQQ